MCVCPETISASTPSGEQGPAGGGGHSPDHVQPGLTLAMDPAGGCRRRRRRRRRRMEERGREREREEGRDGGGPVGFLS